MSLSLIVAMTPARLIGKDNSLPWRLPEDLQRFKNLTMGHPILMGRKTWDSLGRPLPGRENMVLSRSLDTAPEGTSLFSKWEAAAVTASSRDGFVIGGKALFEKALPLIAHAYVTLVHGEYEGDTWFPETDWSLAFDLGESSGELTSKSGVKYEYLDYHRKT
jgi:dihydrofolate reductase